jgi:hypothetical protein
MDMGCGTIESAARAGNGGEIEQLLHIRAG